MSWTQDDIELLEKLWAEGRAGSQIAARLGRRPHSDKLRFTRNAVIGKAHRLGLVKRGPATFEYRDLKLRPTARKNKATGIAALEIAVLGRSARLPRSHWKIEPLPPEQPPPSKPIVFADLEPQHCRYPYGDHVKTFCGAKKIEGMPYCAEHAAICFQPPRPKRQPEVIEPAYAAEYWHNGVKVKRKVRERA